jgi:hypothetical protein
LAIFFVQVYQSLNNPTWPASLPVFVCFEPNLTYFLMTDKLAEKLLDGNNSREVPIASLTGIYNTNRTTPSVTNM